MPKNLIVFIMYFINLFNYTFFNNLKVKFWHISVLILAKNVFYKY